MSLFAIGAILFAVAMACIAGWRLKVWRKDREK